MNKYVLVILLTLLENLHCFPQSTLDLQTLSINEGIGDTRPTRLLEKVSDGIIVDYNFRSVNVLPDDLYPNSKKLMINGLGINSSIEEPSYLFRWDTFVIPSDFSYSIQLLDSSYVDVHLSLSPARPFEWDDSYIPLSLADVPEIAPYNGMFPSKVIPLTKKENYCDNVLLNVCVCPIRYDYRNNITRIFTHIRYKVYYEKNNRNNNSNHNNTFLSNIALNYEKDQIKRYNKSGTNNQLQTESYLIVTTPSYYESANRLAEWKRNLGYDVTIQLKNSWTPTDIKNTVRSIADSINITQLLLLGGHNSINAEFSNIRKEHYTDYYYGFKNGDSIPSISVGRIPVSNIDEAGIVVNKIINYERYPTCDSMFYKRGLHCAYFQEGDSLGFEDRRFTKTAEEIKEYMEVEQQKKCNRVYYTEQETCPTHWNNTKYSFGEEIPDSLKKPTFLWDGNAENIKQHINNGVFYTLLRDHGQPRCWCEPYFTSDNIQELSNGNKLPIVFSICCSTGNFVVDTCFCESFLKKEDGGCVGIFGASHTSLSGPNDALACAMFDAIWPNPGLVPRFPNIVPDTINHIPVYSLGAIMNQGKQRMKETWYPLKNKQKDYITYSCEVFHCFGDPSMEIYTDLPVSFEHVVIDRNNGHIHVNLNGETAIISVYDKMSGLVNNYFGGTADYYGNDQSAVCVHSHNRIPFVDDPNSDLYIQNQFVSGPARFHGNTIEIGSHVTDDKEYGPVVFDGGQIQILGNEITIKENTEVTLGTSLTLTPQ